MADKDIRDVVMVGAGPSALAASVYTTREDIDKAMKLGTNYPHGPFEWCERIGVKHVYEVLEAVYEDTKDERYMISPLLKKEYLSLSV